MKSRISFCNGHVLKKDILRFAPLWAVYTVFLAVWAFNNSALTNASVTAERMAYSISQNMGNVFFLFCIYGFGCATLLFGDLFRTRMAGGLHAMPLRRETWFGTHVVSGILFAAVPNAVIAIVMAIVLGEYAFVAGLWWLALTGQFLFHFGLGVLCVMLSGNLLGHAATFGTISGFSMIVHSVYDSVYEPMLYGITTQSKWFEFFCPVQFWTSVSWLQWDVQHTDVVMEAYSYDKGVSTTFVTDPKYIYEGIITKEWIYLGVCVLLAAVFLGVALYLYRRRKLEWAGDFITSKFVGWVFLILGSVCAAVIVPVVGFAIAFFGILMLWERTLKVFRKKNLIAFGISAVAVLLTIGLTALDVTGITTRVPELAQVESVTLNPQWDGSSTPLTDPADIQAVLTAHEYALVDRDPDEGGWYGLEVEYTLKDGSTLRRSYDMNAHVPALDGIQKILSRWDIIFDGRDLQEVESQLIEVSFYVEEYDKEGYYTVSRDVYIPPEDWGEMLEAIRLDCMEGNMCQNSVFHEGALHTLNFRYFATEKTAGYRHGIHVFEDSSHTMAFLQQYMQ